MNLTYPEFVFLPVRNVKYRLFPFTPLGKSLDLLLDAQGLERKKEEEIYEPGEGWYFLLREYESKKVGVEYVRKLQIPFANNPGGKIRNYHDFTRKEITVVDNYVRIPTNLFMSKLENPCVGEEEIDAYGVTLVRAKMKTRIDFCSNLEPEFCEYASRLLHEKVQENQHIDVKFDDNKILEFVSNIINYQKKHN